jgi:F420-dependent oxidoreductase-like protein
MTAAGTAPIGPAALRVMTEPQQGSRYEKLLSLARAAEAAGWDGFFRSDHLLTIGSSEKRDATEAWTTLAGLARETKRLRLGTLVSPMTFRHPSLLARMVSTVDQMSGGRVELGVGAGWFEEEHEALGIRLPPMRERMERFEEAVEVISMLLSGATVDHHGPHLELKGAVSLPRPAQNRLPLIVGGHGGARSLRVAARFADEYNTTARPGDETATVFRRVREACEREGRDPHTMRLSWMGPCIVGDNLEVQHRRAAPFAPWLGPGDHEGAEVLKEFRGRGVVGTPEEASAVMGGLRDLGCDLFYLQLIDLDDLEQVSDIASLVASRALG